MSSLQQRFEAQLRLMQESARSLAALALTHSGGSLAGSALQDADILMRRKEVKSEFICAKKAARELLLEMLPSERAPREEKLLSVQAELRAADARLKALDLSAMEPTGTAGNDAAACCAAGAAKFPFPSAPRTNDEYLDSALDIVASTTAQLKDGLSTLISIKIEAVHAAATVETNHEKVRSRPCCDGVPVASAARSEVSADCQRHWRIVPVCEEVLTTYSAAPAAHWQAARVGAERDVPQCKAAAGHWHY